MVASVSTNRVENLKSLFLTLTLKVNLHVPHETAPAAEMSGT